MIREIGERVHRLRRVERLYALLWLAVVVSGLVGALIR